MNSKKQDRSTISREPELAVLNTLISTTHTWTDTQDVLSIALEQVVRLSDADGAECHLVNSAGELEFTALSNLDPGFIAGSSEIRFPPGIGIPGLAYASQSAIYIGDIASEERYLRRGLAKQAGYRSLICIPITGMDTLLGTFILYYKEEVQPNAELQKVLTTVGKQMGIAVERARLFQQTEKQLKELQVLQTVSNALNRSVNFQEALEQSLEAVISAMQLRSGWVVLLEESQGVRLAAAYNLPPELHPDDWAAMPAPCQCIALLQQGLLKSAVNIIECQQLRKVTDPQHPFRHHASIPIRAGNLVLGNLNLVTPPDRVFTENELRMFNAIGDQVGVAVERMRLLEQVKAQRIEEQAALLKLSQALLVESKPQAIMETVVHMTASMLNVEFAALALVDPVEQTFSGRAAIGWPPEVLRQAQRIPLTASTGLAYAIRSRAPVVIPDESRETRFGTPPWVAEMGFASSLLVPIIVNGEIIGGLVINSRSARNWTDDEIRLLSLIANQTAIAIDNTRLFESLVNEQHNTAQLYHLSLELAANLKPDDVAKRALLAALETVGASRGNILTLEEDGERLRLLAVTGYDRETAEALNQRLDWDVSQGVTGRVVRTCKATIVPDVSRDADWVPISGLDDWVQSMLSVPLVAGDRIVGVLNLLSEQLDFFKIKNLSLLTTIASPVALSLQNARLYESLRQRLAELEILADTSSALRKAQSHDDIPPILLAKAVEGLKANAGVLLLLDNDELKFVATHGATGVSKGGVCPPGAGMMWQALESDKPIFIPDVTQIEELQKNVLCQALMGDALSCACVLLRTAASTIGVVYLNWKKKSFFSADESRLLESLAEIAANAIHRSTLHEQTARQALDLTQAYDATIEGWSHALDLRDRETEGHTQRVTDLTLKLARAMEIGEPEIAHIRRGALLHDIGKMGIPDNILRKPGALNEDEWAVMRQHPQFAHEMLSPIDYLQPALDIPWCHHEKWDGSGYPRGLKGEEIPLTARIFAVVDVFDALTSDRPYRPAWTKRKVIAYIRQQAGIHFDPKVVETFLKMIGKK